MQQHKPSKDAMASFRRRALSCSLPPITEEAERRIRDCILRNDKMARRIENGKVKLSFKCDLEVKRVKEMIKQAKEKLDQLENAAVQEIETIARSRESELQPLFESFVVRASDMRHLLDSSTSLPETEVDSTLARWNTEIDTMDQWLNSCWKFDLILRREVAENCRKLLKEEKPFHIHAASLSPSEVRLVYGPPTNAFSPAVITIKAEPKYKVSSLHGHVTATLKRLDGLQSSPLMQGSITSVNDEHGSAMITFPPVSQGKEYVARVYLRGEEVSNSPMILHVRANDEDDTHCFEGLLWSPSQAPKTCSGNPSLYATARPTSAGGELEFPTPSTATAASFALKVLANRARLRSAGNPAGLRRDPKAPKSVTVAVAPKGLFMGMASMMNRDNGGGMV